MAFEPSSMYTVGEAEEFRWPMRKSTVCTKSPWVSSASMWSMDHSAAM